MNRIGWGQMAVILAISRIFSEATAIPETTLEYGMQRYSVIILSFAMALAAYAPIYYISCRFPEKSFISLCAEVNRPTACILAAALTVGLLSAMSETFVRLKFYASSTIFDAAPAPLLFVIITLICLYALYKGIQATARTGVITAAGFVLLLGLTAAALFAHIRTDRVYIAFSERPEVFWDEVITEFSHNSEILIFASLGGRVRSKAARAIPLYLGISCLTLLIMTFLYNTVLGEYLGSVNFPFYTLSSLSDIALFQRLNGIDAMIWVMAAAVKLSLLAISVREIFRDSFGNKKAAFCTAAGSLIASAVFAYCLVSDIGVFEMLLGVRSTGIPLLVTAVTLPLAALAAMAVGKRKERLSE